MFWWYFVYFCLVVEVILITLLILPMPHIIHKFIYAGLKKLWKNNLLRILILCVVIFIGSLAVESWMGMIKYKEMKEAAKSSQGYHVQDQMSANMQMFRSQRNFYLAATTDFLIFILFGFNQYLNIIDRLEGQIKELKSQ